MCINECLQPKRPFLKEDLNMQENMGNSVESPGQANAFILTQIKDSIDFTICYQKLQC